MTDSTDLIYQGSPLPLNQEARRTFSQDTVDLIASDMGKGAPAGKLYAFLELSARYELDPFTGEIWLANMGGANGGAGRWAILVGRDGYLKNARRDPDFIDVDADVVYSEDTFEVVRKPDGSRTVTHSYGNPAKRGEALGAYAVLRRKGKPDAYFYAPLEQYAKRSDKSAWSYRDAMAIKSAVSYIARITYGVSGMVPFDEVNGGLAVPQVDPSTGAGPAGTGTPTKELPGELEELFARAQRIDPKSWRRNEVSARVFDGDGDVLDDEVRRVTSELQSWLWENEPVDAEVVDPDSDDGGEVSFDERFTAAADAEPGSPDQGWRAEVIEQASRRDRARRGIAALEPDQDSFREHLEQEAAEAERELTEAGAPDGWELPAEVTATVDA